MKIIRVLRSAGALRIIVAALVLGCGGAGGTDATTGPGQPARVSAVEMTATSIVLDVGENRTITATPKDASGRVVAGKFTRWSTSDGTIVDGSVDGNTATIRGFGAGSASVTADIEGVKGTVTVEVRPTASQPISSIGITPPSATIFVGETLPLVATLRDAAGNTLTGRLVAWNTGDKNVLDGQMGGNIAITIGLAPGTVTVFASSEGNVGTATVTVLSGSSEGAIPLTCGNIAGGQIYAQDGQYLGLLANSVNSGSILNQVGRYGSPVSSTSMYNTVSRYGSSVGSLSAFNPASPTPPLLYKNGRFLAYVTKNTIKTPGVNPDAFPNCSSVWG